MALELPVNHLLPESTASQTAAPGANKRAADRRALAVPARLTWKDHRGATRFASVVTRNASDFGVFVETQSPVSIPLYRLVQFQLERDYRDGEVPASIRQGRVLSAVYRVTQYKGTGRQGLALRLMVDPKRMAADFGERRAADRRATA
jgi:hypothetical protein